MRGTSRLQGRPRLQAIKEGCGRSHSISRGFARSLRLVPRAGRPSRASPGPSRHRGNRASRGTDPAPVRAPCLVRPPRRTRGRDATATRSPGEGRVAWRQRPARRPRAGVGFLGEGARAKRLGGETFGASRTARGLPDQIMSGSIQPQGPRKYFWASSYGIALTTRSTSSPGPRFPNQTYPGVSSFGRPPGTRQTSQRRSLAR